MVRGDLTDDEWALVDPHLPLGERGPIPDLRRQFNGVMWRFRTGSPWRDLPEEYGSWSTVYDRFRSWATSAWSAWTPPRPAHQHAAGMGRLVRYAGPCWFSRCGDVRVS
ncbi:hypothetical protein GCM10022226_79140 [Sphaerisporangium flaviroseum]|uniref:Insertion element IS402-like domain-containing protein n=1 Tax=Sphaerisporangium flaviroseum TaxID=509199 RepID=A0ABP7JG38_9ACTN